MNLATSLFPHLRLVLVLTALFFCCVSMSSAQNGRIIQMLKGNSSYRPSNSSDSRELSSTTSSNAPEARLNRDLRRDSTAKRKEEKIERRIEASRNTTPRRRLFFKRGNTHDASATIKPSAPASRYVVSPPNRYLYINQQELGNLTPANSWIEIDISDQRVRVYKAETLIIESQISTGKPGYATGPGFFTITEKLEEKRSGRYGTWFDAEGKELEGDDIYEAPAGAVKFVGSDMPFWLRINGGIGMHIGFVPDVPASHGCIRVPSTVQPLIFSKVKVGTTVQIKP